GKFTAAVNAFADRPADLVDVELPFGHENAMRAAGHSRMRGDPAGVPAHNFDNHDALVRFGSGVETIDRFRYDLNSSVETERVVGAGQVVIDGLGNADNRVPFLLEK